MLKQIEAFKHFLPYSDAKPAGQRQTFNITCVLKYYSKMLYRKTAALGTEKNNRTVAKLPMGGILAASPRHPGMAGALAGRSARRDQPGFRDINSTRKLRP